MSVFAKKKREFLPFREDTSLALCELESGTAVHTLPNFMVQFFWHFGFAVAALLLSALTLAKGVSPFPLAFVAALPPNFAISAAFGAATGYILTGDSVSALRYVAAIVCAATLSKLLYSLEAQKHADMLSACIGFFSSFLTAAAVLTAEGFSFAGIHGALKESVLTFALTYAFFKGLEGVEELTIRHKLSSKHMPYLAFGAVLLLCTLSDWTLFSIAFSRVAAITLLLWLLYTYAKEPIAPQLGLAAALSLCWNEAVGIHAVSYLLALTVSGKVLSKRPKLMALSFVLSFSACFLLAQHTENLALLYEVLFGTALFLMMPKKWRDSLQIIRTVEPKSANTKAERTAAYFRLKNTASALDHIANTVESVSGVMTKQEDSLCDSETACLYAKQIVCENCAFHKVCTEKHKEETQTAFQKMQERLAENKLLEVGYLPPVFRSRCAHAEALCEYINRRYIRLTEQQKLERTVGELRKATAQNLKGLCTLLKQLSLEMAKEPKFDARAEEIATQALFRDCNLTAKALSCRHLEGGHLAIDLLFSKDSKILLKKALIEAKLEHAFGLVFDPPEVKEEGENIRISFLERRPYTVEFGKACYIPNEGKYCGDNTETFYDADGNFYAVLSDGMGQGKRAAFDSALTISFFMKLIEGGISVPSAIQSTNALLLLKSEEESLSTLDVLKINLYSGKAVFYKAGGAKSLIRQKDTLQKIENASLPLGILESCNYARTEGELSTTETIVLGSDGAFDFTDKEVEKALLHAKRQPLQNLSEYLVEIAKNASPENHVDDITVLALQLQQKAPLFPTNSKAS